MLIVTLKLMACKRSQSDLRVLACPLSRVLVGRKLGKIGVFSTVGEPHIHIHTYKKPPWRGKILHGGGSEGRHAHSELEAHGV